MICGGCISQCRRGIFRPILRDDMSSSLQAFIAAMPWTFPQLYWWIYLDSNCMNTQSAQMSSWVLPMLEKQFWCLARMRGFWTQKTWSCSLKWLKPAKKKRGDRSMFCYLLGPISPCHQSFGLWSPFELPITAKYYQRLGSQPTHFLHSYTTWKVFLEKGDTRAAAVLHKILFKEEMWQAASATPRLLDRPAVLQPQHWLGTLILDKCFDNENLRLCTQN